MKLAVLMDPLEQLDPHKDSTLAMLAAARQRNWTCDYFTLQDLYGDNGQIYANMTSVDVAENASQWRTQALGVQLLRDYDLILIRKDPPFDLAYMYATQLLSLVEKDRVLVTNKPQSLRNFNEKLSILQYPNACVPTLVTSDMDRLKRFWAQHRSVIFKPLDAMGGHNIFHVEDNGRNLSVILQFLTAQQTMPIMAQRYIPEIGTYGDKRIIMINGQPVAYALARFAAAGESRANLMAGGHGKVVAITDHDRQLCEMIAPSLQAQSLYFVGIDVIGDYITEINVTSPTCIRQIQAETDLDIAGDYLDFLATRTER